MIRLYHLAYHASPNADYAPNAELLVAQSLNVFSLRGTDG